MYLGEAIAKGGINAKLYRNAEEAIVIASRVDLDTGMGFDSHTF